MQHLEHGRSFCTFVDAARYFIRPLVPNCPKHRPTIADLRAGHEELQASVEGKRYVPQIVEARDPEIDAIVAESPQLQRVDAWLRDRAPGLTVGALIRHCHDQRYDYCPCAIGRMVREVPQRLREMDSPELVASFCELFVGATKPEVCVDVSARLPA